MSVRNGVAATRAGRAGFCSGEKLLWRGWEERSCVWIAERYAREIQRAGGRGTSESPQGQRNISREKRSPATKYETFLVKQTIRRPNNDRQRTKGGYRTNQPINQPTNDDQRPVTNTSPTPTRSGVAPFTTNAPTARQPEQFNFTRREDTKGTEHAWYG